MGGHIMCNLELSVPVNGASVGSANNMNKLSLVGMQLPEKYKENFNVSSEGPSSGVTRKVNISC
jgi:hypothetical protein